MLLLLLLLDEGLQTLDILLGVVQVGDLVLVEEEPEARVDAVGHSRSVLEDSVHDLAAAGHALPGIADQRDASRPRKARPLSRWRLCS